MQERPVCMVVVMVTVAWRFQVLGMLEGLSSLSLPVVHINIMRTLPLFRMSLPRHVSVLEKSRVGGF